LSSEPAFWDSSALIPRCIREATSRHAEKLAERYSLVVWWGTILEMRGGFARVTRSGVLDGAGKRVAVATLSELAESWREIAPDSELREQAGELLDRHALRVADSLQLAAALVWGRGKAAQRVFISSDARLCEAAAAEGFTVIRPENEAG
jgi:predicted nucleic acid-binding protein